MIPLSIAACHSNPLGKVDLSSLTSGFNPFLASPLPTRSNRSPREIFQLECHCDATLIKDFLDVTDLGQCRYNVEAINYE